jgi:hypothetical protein
MAAAPKASSNLLPGIVIGAVIAGAAVYALTRNDKPTGSPSTPNGSVVATPKSEIPPGHPNVPGSGLPPNHPPMGGSGAAAMPGPPPGPAVVVWTPPSSWKSVPSVSQMRLATYEIPHQAGDAEDPQLSVIRAGGDTKANIDRWIGQFDEPARATAKQEERTVNGMKASILYIEGTFSGGMGMGMGGAEGPQAGWALLGAIVETPGGGAHFFKMTGPKKSVAASRPQFDELIASIKPAS